MIYIGIPAHDERHTIGVLMWSVRKVLLEEEQDFHLMVVDDGSTDGTSDVLEPYRDVLPLTIVRHEARRGYAASVERLVREVLDRSDYHKRDGLITLEADFTHAPGTVPEMLRRFQSGADLVVGAPRERRAVPRRIRVGRWGASFLTDGLPTPPEVEDPLCGFRLYRLFLLQRALEDLPSPEAPLLHHGGWAANAELLIRVWPHVRQWDQVDVTVDYSRRYRGSRFRLLPELWELYRASRDERLEAEAPRPAAHDRAS